MLQVNHILALVDASSPSCPALTTALVLASQRGASVSVLPMPTVRGASVPAPAEAGPAPPWPRRLQAWADAHPRPAAPPGPRVTVPGLEASADASPPTVPALLDYAREAAVDLIVADTPQDRGAIPALASSPLRSVVEGSRAPVYVVGHRSPASVRRILVPTDFSEHARLALAHADALASLYGASLDILHVLERPQYIALNTTDLLALNDATLTERKAHRRVQSFLASVGGTAATARTHLRHGEAGDTISRFLNDEPIDLVVFATHGTLSRPTHALGTVADRLLRRVACPVFLTRAFGHSLVDLPPSGSDGLPTGTPDLSARP